jgi:hypothetical protein
LGFFQRTLSRCGEYVLALPFSSSHRSTPYLSRQTALNADNFYSIVWTSPVPYRLFLRRFTVLFLVRFIARLFLFATALLSYLLTVLRKNTALARIVFDQLL